MRVVATAGGSAWFNVAAEEATALASGRGGYAAGRVWLQGPAVVVGYSIGLCDEVDCGLAAKLGVPVVRRFTGGGAVYHDWGNLNVSLAVPERLGVDEVYRMGTGVVLAALERLGVRGHVENEGDVVVEGCKVSGSAAGIKARSSFYHATLLVEADMEVLRAITIPRLDRVERGEVTPAKYRPCSLRELGYDVSLAEALESLAASVEEALHSWPAPPPGWWERDVEPAAARLCRERYSTPRYTLQRPAWSCVEPLRCRAPAAMRRYPPGAETA